MKSTRIKSCLIILTVILVRAGIYSKIRGQYSESQQVNATIQLSICGNETAEGGEECDTNDLNDQTCESLGYAGGSLSCDLACDFERGLCISPTPTPTPSATPTPTITPTPTTAPPTAAPSPTLKPKPTLPGALQIFDVRGIGRILIDDLQTVVELWVIHWKNMQGTENCDMNKDNHCDLRDFSILMFYVER